MSQFRNTISMIFGNNPKAVEFNLATKGLLNNRVMPALGRYMLSIDEILNIVKRHFDDTKYSTMEQYAFLVQVFDVPILADMVHAKELTQMRQKSPLKQLFQISLMQDSGKGISYDIDSTVEENIGDKKKISAAQMATIIVVGSLLVIGAFSVLKFIYKILKNNS